MKGTVMWKELQPELISLTPEAAEQHQARPHLDGDRDVESTSGRKRIKWLDAKVQNEQFFTPRWVLAFYDGKWWRIDGGHSSKMLVSCNGHFPHGKFVNVLRFECETLEDLTDLYNQFDSYRSRRTMADKAKASASIHDNIKDVRPTWITRAISGIVFYANDAAPTKMDEDDRIAYIHSDPDFIRWSLEYVRHRHLSSNGPVAAMYRAFAADEDQATEFWSAVRDKTATTPEHPTRILAEYLGECASVAMKTSPRSKIFYSPRARYVKCIHAWNAWQHGTTTDLKYHHRADIPKMVIVDASGNSKSI